MALYLTSDLTQNSIIDSRYHSRVPFRWYGTLKAGQGHGVHVRLARHQLKISSLCDNPGYKTQEENSSRYSSLISGSIESATEFRRRPQGSTSRPTWNFMPRITHMHLFLVSEGSRNFEALIPCKVWSFVAFRTWELYTYVKAGHCGGSQFWWNFLMKWSMK